MKKLLFLFVLAHFFVFQIEAQTCSAVPEVDAVQNGDFEAGYILSGPAVRYGRPSHAFIPGGDFDFFTDASFAEYSTVGCMPGAADNYYGISNNANCINMGGFGAHYIGMNYIIDRKFEDHTPGEGGNGHALVVDFAGTVVTTSPYANNPVVWQQEIDVDNGEDYYFSAWFANYNKNADGWTLAEQPSLVFVVYGQEADLSYTRMELGTGPIKVDSTMQWDQFYEQWSPAGAYTRAFVSIEIIMTGGTDGNDIALDDISFMKGCDGLEVTGDFTPDLGADFSLCATGGADVLDINAGAESFNDIQWYEVTGGGDITIPSGSGSQTLPVDLEGPNVAGTYRVCTEEVGKCARNSYITIFDDLDVMIDDVELCESLSEEVDCGVDFSPPITSIAWDDGTTITSDTRTITVTEPGNYTVTIAGGGNCNDVANFSVTSLLPTPDEDPFTVCSGATDIDLTVTDPTGVGSIDWYDAATLGNQVATGTTTYNYVLGAIPNTFYAENAASDLYDAGYPTVQNGGWSTVLEQRKVDFEAHVPLVIRSVDLRPVSGTGHCQNTPAPHIFRIELYSGVGAGAVPTGTFYDHTVDCSGGGGIAGTAPVNFSVPAGNYQLMISTANAGTWQTENGPQPTSVPGIITVSKANAPVNSGPFYNWKIDIPTVCIRVPVEVESCCPTFDQVTINEGFATTCAAGGSETLMANKIGNINADADYDFRWMNGTTEVQTWTNGTAGMTLSYANIISGGSGTYTVEMRVTASPLCIDISAGVTVTVNPLPTAALSGTDVICDDGVTTGTLNPVFTGAQPWDIGYTDGDGAAQVLLGITTSPADITSLIDGTYTLTSVSDANCDGTVSGSGDIDYFVDVVATASTECNNVNASLEADEFQIRVTVTQGDFASIAITETTANGVSFTDQGGGVWLSNPINVLNTVDINVTDVNDCNGGVDITGLQGQCSCPTSGTLAFAAGSSSPVCPEDNATLEVTFAGGTGPFNLTLIGSISGAGTPVNGAATGETFVVSAEETYTVQIENTGEACTVSTGSVALAHHTVPTASLSGTADICDDGVTMGTLNPILTGAQPWDIGYTDGDGAAQVLLGITTSPANITSLIDGTYTLTSVSDANCTGTAGGSGDIDYFVDVVATASTECNNVNASLETDEFQIRVTVTEGDFATVNISETTANGVSFTDQGGGIWLSNPIDEANSVDIDVTDASDCNGGVELTGLQTQCSCPTITTLASTSATEICAGESVGYEITEANGIGPYNFTITGSEGTVITEAGATLPYTNTLNTEEVFTVTVMLDQGQDCAASRLGEVDVTVNALPTAILSETGTTNICSGDATDPFKITFTGTPNFTYEYAIDGVPQGTMTSTSLVAPIPGATSGPLTYTMVSVSDANCDGTPTGTINVTEQSRPTADLSISSDKACAGDAAPTIIVTLTGAPPYTIEYTDGNGNPGTGSSTTGTFPISGATAVGSYHYKVTSVVDENCPDTAITGDGIYEVHAIPTVIYSGGEQICSDGSSPAILTATFTGETPINYTYTTPAGVMAMETSSTLNPPSYMSSEAGTHTISSVSDANCPTSQTASTTITHSTPKVLTIEPDRDSICVTDNVGITVRIISPAPTSLTGTIEWYKSPSTVALAGENEDNINLTATGNNGSYTATIDDGICPAASTLSNTVVIQIDGIPQVSIDGQSLVTFEGEDITINGTVISPATSMWTSDPDLNGLIDVTSDTVTFAPTTGGLYDYTLTATNGKCSKSASYFVTVIQPVKIPNAFTPNGDTQNDVWDIRGMSTYTEAVVKIFNRWGNLVYEQFGQYEQWDGTNKNNGKELPVGTYYYLIDLGVETPGHPSSERRGHVSIIR